MITKYSEDNKLTEEFTKETKKFISGFTSNNSFLNSEIK